MEFNTPIFLFAFLPVFMLVYHLAGYRGKLIAGVLGSLLLYAGGNLQYVPLLVGMTLAAHGLGRRLDADAGARHRSVWLWAGLLGGVALVVAFKLATGLAYPLGLSYLTFQAMSYLLEVHGRRTSAEPDLLRFSFYLMLFPKIPVGPIVRYSSVRQQIGELKAEPGEIAAGLRRFIRGLAKKVLIADTLARVVDPIFKLSAPLIPASWAWLILVSYAVQLFLDFSGYTDMALGLGRMLGLTFPENFNFPYLARSIGDFWRRWHISLATWFRDFVFYPLERRRLKWIGQPLNTLIVFLLVGLWHGLGLTFLAWGLIHGLALVFESTRLGRSMLTRWPFLARPYTLAVILAGWVFFRSPTLPFAMGFFQRLLGDRSGLTAVPFEATLPLPFIEPSFVMALVVGLLLCFPVGSWFGQLRQRLIGGRPALRHSSQLLYDAGLLATMIISLAAMAASNFAPGIYGKF